MTKREKCDIIKILSPLYGRTCRQSGRISQAKGKIMKKLRILGAFLAGVIAVSGVPDVIQPLTASISAASTKLAAPKSVTATTTDTKIKLSWKKVKGASAYRVYMYNATKKKYVEYKNVSGVNCVVTGLKAGKTYKFKIVALVKSGKTYVEQTPTGAKSVTTKLSAPKNFKANVSNTTVKLTWSKVTGASAYRVLVYDKTKKKFVTYKNMSGTSCTIKNLKPGAYWYKVVALKKTSGKYVAQQPTAFIKVKVVKTTTVTVKEHTSGYKYGSKIYPIKHDVSYMKKLNSDFVGWLQIKDTPIDIPILQATDNKYYLTHDFYGRVDNSNIATTFMDSHIKLSETSRPDNIIIYGHNSKTGAGLAKVTNYYPARYGSLNFYKTHPTFTFETVYGGESTYVAFAGMFVNTSTKQGTVFNYYKTRSFKSTDVFYKYFEQVFDRSVFYNPDVDIKFGDKFLTLSTCYYPYGEAIDTRFVLFARQLRSGEKVSSIKTKNAYINKSPLYFSYYYKVNGGSWAGRKWPESLMQGYSAWKKTNA